MRSFVLLAFLIGCAPSVGADSPLIPAYNALERRLVYLDSQGRIALETEYGSGGFFRDGLARVCGQNCGFINEQGEQLFGFDYHRIDEISEERIPFCGLPGQCGFLNARGEVSIPPEFQDVQSFSEGLAGAKKNGLWGFIDRSGQWKVAPAYGSVLPFSEGKASVQSSKPPHLFGIIDSRGEVVLKFKHQKIYSYSGGLARFFHWDRFGYLNRTGLMVLTAQLEWAEDPVSGLSYFVHQSSQGYRVGKNVILQLDCPGGHSFSGGPPVVALTRDCQTGLFQYLDGKGGVWKSGLADATVFRNGYAFIRRPAEDNYRLVDQRGKEYSLPEGIEPAW